MSVNLILKMSISIHAPTRGATASKNLHEPIELISIHAPTRGATLAFVPLVKYMLIFQSTLPREERRRTFQRLEKSFLISIHAPTRGATLARQLPKPTLQYFNPRSHERSDIDVLQTYWFDIISIHAPTRGATCEPMTKTYPIYISIHAPTRGATVDFELLDGCYFNFNPRSHERSDYFLSSKNVCEYISIHAPTRGAT